jgi:quercetin dioxygenase-like cupin family protein
MRTPLLVFALVAAHTAGAQNSNLHWGPAPPSLPPGARMAIVSGDPTKPGPFEIQLDLPNGFTIAPHFHPTDEHQTVISGQFGHGMGDTTVAKSMTWLRRGESGTIPANAHHYAMARGHTILVVSSTGPFVVTYVNAADDPRKTKK